MTDTDRASTAPSNPFTDRATVQDERETMAEATLSIDRNATLTLGTDAVIVLGASSRRWIACVSNVWQMKDYGVPVA
jgi:hypothetical protein